MSKSNYAAVGGQAVMEGIMMRSPVRSVLAVRTPSGEIVTEEMQSKSLRERFRVLRLPIIRGCVSFVEGMVVGYKALMRSAELAGLDEETGGNKWVNGLITGVSLILGVGIAVALFLMLPQFLGRLIAQVFPGARALRILIEGLIRIVLFVVYIFATSLMKEMKDLYRYHGAEHKTIFTVEAREPLTVENVRKQSRLHPRCGTSFIFLVFLFSILFFTLLHAFVLPASLEGILRTLVHIAFLPLVAGCTFEIQQWTGRRNNWFTRLISAPGKALQRITTAEPTDRQIEVAIEAMNASLRNEAGEVDFSLAYKKKSCDGCEKK